MYKPTSPIVPGTQFGRYRVVTTLGEGGMAVVYLAEMEGKGGFSKLVALKVVRPGVALNPLFAESFVSEARLGGLLSHPNIVEIFDFGEHEGLSYLGMEYVDGLSLRNLIAMQRNSGDLIAPELCLRLLARVCHGLAYAHDATDHRGRALKMVHRDIKPANILVSAVGKVKIADFGVARAESNVAETQADGLVKGSVHYMSPEQANGDRDLDRRSDLFSLGIVLFELLTLTPLYKDSSLMKLLRTAQDAEAEEQLTRIAEGPLRDPLVRLLRKALARDRNDRFQNAAEFSAAMDAILELSDSRPSLNAWLARTVPRSTPGAQSTPVAAASRTGHPPKVPPAKSSTPSPPHDRPRAASSDVREPTRVGTFRPATLTVTSIPFALEPQHRDGMASCVEATVESEQRSMTSDAGSPDGASDFGSEYDPGQPLLDISNDLTVRDSGQKEAPRRDIVGMSGPDLTHELESVSARIPPTLVSPRYDLEGPDSNAGRRASGDTEPYTEGQEGGVGQHALVEALAKPSRTLLEQQPWQSYDVSAERGEHSSTSQPSGHESETLVLARGSGDQSRTLDYPRENRAASGSRQTLMTGEVARQWGRLERDKVKYLAFAGLVLVGLIALWALWPGSFVTSDHDAGEAGSTGVTEQPSPGARPGGYGAPTPAPVAEEGTPESRTPGFDDTPGSRPGPIGPKVDNPMPSRPRPDPSPEGDPGRRRQHFILPGDRTPCLAPEDASRGSAGVLTLNSRPCRSLFVDEMKLNGCPIENCWVSSGEHSIRFADHRSGRELRRVVKVPAGRRLSCAGVFDSNRVICEEGSIDRNR